jgi:hypothetical protein
MEQKDRTVVAVFVLVLLGLSYLAAVQAVAAGYRLPAAAAYVVCAGLLLWRLR